MGFTLILPWQGPWKCTFFLHPSGFNTNFLLQPMSCQAQQCAGIRGPAQHCGEQGELPWDVMSLTLIPAREDFAPWLLSSGLTPTTRCCTAIHRSLQTSMEPGGGKCWSVVLLPALDSGVLTSEHPTRTSPRRDPAAPGSEAQNRLQQRALSSSVVSLFCRETGFGVGVFFCTSNTSERRTRWGLGWPQSCGGSSGPRPMQAVLGKCGGNTWQKGCPARSGGSEESALMCGPDLSANQPQTSYLPGTSAGQRSPGPGRAAKGQCHPGGGESSRKQQRRRDGTEQSTNDKRKEETGKEQKPWCSAVHTCKAKLLRGTTQQIK